MLIKKKAILILNWIVWNRTVYMYKNGFGINSLQWWMCYKTKPNKIQNFCAIEFDNKCYLLIFVLIV